MKRNRIFWLFAVVLVLTMVSTSLVSGTFAKYTKQVSATDTARVAKFAFDLSDGTNTLDEATAAPVSIDLFDTVDAGLYDDGTDGTFIAPGTTGSVVLSLDNLSEVDITVAFALTETNAGNIPIYYTIGAGTQRYSAVLSGDYVVSVDTLTYQTLAQMQTALNALAGTVQASDGTTAVSLADITLNWTWAFETAGTGQSDTLDTALGVAGTATVKLDIACTVTQVD